MRKLTLSFLMLGVMLIIAGSVSATDTLVTCQGPCDVNIINPEQGNYYGGEDLLIDWDATGDCGSSWNVYYAEKDPETGCRLDTETWGEGFLGTAHITQLPWDISDLEGQYCVKIEGFCCEDEVEGPFIIDHTAPEVEICVGCGSDGDELNHQASFDLDASDNNGVESCEINWGDGIVENCQDLNGENFHQYGDNGEYEVTVTVTDSSLRKGSKTFD